MRKVFLENLPRYENGKNKGKINWLKSIGYKVKFIYDDIEGWIEIVDIKKKYILIKYIDKIKTMRVSLFASCGIGEILGKKTRDFKFEIGKTLKDDSRDITIIDRKYEKDKNNVIRKHYKLLCNKCGFNGDMVYYINGELREEHWMLEGNLEKGQGCPCCCESPQAIVPHINSIVANKETHWMIKYFQGGYDEAKRYSKGSNKKIFPICPDCGEIKDREIGINKIHSGKSMGCNRCGDGLSFGHKYMFNLLTQLNQNFIGNYTFKWCKFYNPYKEKEATGEYDFVLEELKLIIEVDGDFHRKDNGMSGQTKEHSKYLDDIKELLAYNNGYKIIRISDEGSIKGNVLNSELVDYFNLSNIDFKKCEEFALKNRVKEACEIKRDNPNITTTEIGEIMNLSKNTIAKYLKKGSKIWGWCNYNAKEEMIKSNRKNAKENGKKRSKSVEIFKDGISLGVFGNSVELTRQSEKLFGVNLNSSNISSVCTGRQKSHKGFTFKYLEQQTNKESA